MNCERKGNFGKRMVERRRGQNWRSHGYNYENVKRENRDWTKIMLRSSKEINEGTDTWKAKVQSLKRL